MDVNEDLSQAVGKATLQEGLESLASDATAPVPKSKAARKKRAKKNVRAQGASSEATDTAVTKSLSDLNNVLISRSKHLKYISSYHGHWLNLPPGVIDTLLESNEEARIDYRRLASEERRLFKAVLSDMGTEKQPVTARAAAKAPSRVEYAKWRTLTTGPTAFDYASLTGQTMPPAVDKSAMRNVMEVRRLVDAATDLLTRATSGMTAAELKSLNNAHDGGGGLVPSRDAYAGRSSQVSAVRQSRLRSMAIAQLGQAFRIDEIATSVILMQVATPFEEAAQKVLKADASNLDAAYVLYYQERIPSRTLCLSTPPDILDRLVGGYQLDHPHLPAMYRSRGILHLYRQDFAAAIKDFDDGVRICKYQAARKKVHRNNARPHGGGRQRGRHNRQVSTGEDTEEALDSDEEKFDIGHTAGDDISRQMLFSRGMAYFLWASDLIERAALGIIGAKVPQDGLSNEGGELSLEGAGVRVPLHDDGLYDRSSCDGYASRFDAAFTPSSPIVERVSELLKQSLRNQEIFQSYFPILEIPPGHVSVDRKQEMEDVAHAARSSAIDRSISFRGRRLIHARALSGRVQLNEARSDGMNADIRLHAPYHPMIGESLFSQILAHLLLGNFEEVLRLHYRATRLLSGLDTALDGRPFFLLGRSLCQSEYHEVLERLAHNWLRKRSPPLGTVTEILQEGPLAALAHVTSFFSPEYEEKLFRTFQHYEEEGERVREQTKEVHPEAHRLLNLLDGRNTNGASGKPVPPAKSHSYGPHSTARSEIALTWVLSARIHPLEEQERYSQAIVSAAGGSSGAGAKGKGKAPQ